MPKWQKGSVFQVALALRILDHLRRLGNNPRVFYQELQIGPGEAQFWMDKGATVLQKGTDVDLRHIPAGAEIYPPYEEGHEGHFHGPRGEGGITLIYFLGNPTPMIEDIFLAYYGNMDKLIFIGDNIQEMDDDFLVAPWIEDPDLANWMLKPLIGNEKWKAVSFPQVPVYKYFTCQICPHHKVTAVQWWERDQNEVERKNMHFHFPG